MITAFLKILELVSFDETLFRKEFVKTLGWVSKEDYSVIEEWMKYNHFSNKFPDLLKLLLTNQS
jgi:type IV secretory pathway TrbF-like protein